MTLKVVGTVRAEERWAAPGEFRKRLLAAFREHGIEIPRPQRVVLAADPAASPPAKAAAAGTATAAELVADDGRRIGRTGASRRRAAEAPGVLGRPRRRARVECSGRQAGDIRER